MLVIITLKGGELPVGQIPVASAIDRITMIADAVRQPRDALIDSAIRRMVSDYPWDRATKTFLTLRERGVRITPYHIYDRYEPEPRVDLVEAVHPKD